MGDIVGCYYKTGGIETGGTNALTGKVLGGTRISLADAETSRAVMSVVDVVYTLYIKCESDTSPYLDAGKNTVLDVTVTAPTGGSVCSTHNGTFGSSCVVTGPKGTFKPFYLKRTSVDSSTPNVQVGTGGVSFVTGTRLGAPTLSVSSNGNGVVTLGIAAFSNETSFVLQRATNSGFTTGVAFTEIDQNITSVQVSGLSNGTTYYWRLGAVDANGMGTWSNTVSELVGYFKFDFEEGTDGNELANGWDVSGDNHPSSHHYDSEFKKNGSLSAMISGPASGTAYAYSPSGAAVLSVNGATEMLWMRHGGGSAYIIDNRAAGADRTAALRVTPGSACGVYTTRSATGFTQNAYTDLVQQNGSAYGITSGEWYRYRFVYDFTNQTYQLYVHNGTTETQLGGNVGGTWSGNIPFRDSTTISQTHGLDFGLNTSGSYIWIDDYEGDNGGLS